MAAKKKKSAYAEAGVDIDVMMNALRRAKRRVQTTYTPDVLSQTGSFGGLFRTPGRDTILVSSIDGVGTKLKVASMANKHDTVGQDLVNHCVNDILVQGAQPLFFMDYVGAAALDPLVFEQVINGLCKACKANGCSLLGGETAEMPGLYPRGEYDLVGTIVGVVEKKKLVTGNAIRHGHVLIGLPSSGLHTNGYSLARKIIFEKAGKKLFDTVPGTRTPFEKALLAVHKSYLQPVMAVMAQVKVSGMAHITGGGLYDNIPRILPEGLCAQIDRATWKTPPLFAFLEEAGRVDHEEMYRVFNMGIGYVLAVPAKEADTAMTILRKKKAQPILIGKMIRGNQPVQLLN
ncbi:MAG: phosphoribosylformylglycinamidine cyclo-ligase [Spartobacteria bacterium]|nr:phosphoribosylformylglycinamidine cyclo-ligase [Spartobacteria bacterium]